MSPAAVISTDQWMLRAKDGQEYGPVPFDVLRGWAAQNRFTAGYEISHNRRAWRPVEVVPELGMDWFVEPGDGSRYGPFHPLALLDYVREGAVLPETRVIHKVNGGKAKAYQVLLEAFVDAIDQTAEVQGELIRQIQSLQERLEERDRWFAGENRQLQEEREKRQELEIEALRQEEQGSQTAGLQARQAQLEAELVQARKEAESERRTRQELFLRLEEELRAARAGADKQIRDAEERLHAMQTRGEAARQSHELRQAELEALKSETAGLQQEVRQAREAGAKLRQEYDARLMKAENQAAEAAGAASRAEAELAVLKGRQERDRQARESEKAQREVRTIAEIRAESEARAASETQQREAAEALSREVAIQRRENAALRDRLESARVEADEAARMDRERTQLRQTAALLKDRLAEMETQSVIEKAELAALRDRGERAVLENEAVNRELESERGRIRILEVRLAQRAEGTPLREERDGVRRRPVMEKGGRPDWASDPGEEVPASGPVERLRPEPDPVRAPPSKKPGSLAGLEAQAQAELKAWQEKKQAPPKIDPASKTKSWIPWKKS